MSVQVVFMKPRYLAPVLPLLGAAAPPRLEVTVGVLREVVRTDAHGKAQTALEPVADTQPGDVLVYRVRAKNVGPSPALEARIDDPIPAGTVLLTDSLPGSANTVHASLDGGKTWQAFPATIAQKRADGVVERVPAPAEAYTHLRWVLPGTLHPGDSAEVGFKVRVQ
jgi:uncharacterized repeat protein (TIGR01451 family)